MGNRLSKIVTRTGDDGSTGLADGARVPKESARIEACGTVDELNSALGVLLAATDLPAPMAEQLLDIQHDLFDLGGELAIPGSVVISASQVESLEELVEEWNAELPPLREFVLPGGGAAAASCHMARIDLPPRRASLLGALAQRSTGPAGAALPEPALGSAVHAGARAGAARQGSEVMWRSERRRRGQALRTIAPLSSFHSNLAPGSLLRPGAMSL